MVTDITLGAGRTTSAASAAKYLKDQGVDILVDNIVNVLAINQVYKGVDILVDNIVNVLAINQVYMGRGGRSCRFYQLIIMYYECIM